MISYLLLVSYKEMDVANDIKLIGLFEIFEGGTGEDLSIADYHGISINR